MHCAQQHQQHDRDCGGQEQRAQAAEPVAEEEEHANRIPALRGLYVPFSVGRGDDGHVPEQMMPGRLGWTIRFAPSFVVRRQYAAFVRMLNEDQTALNDDRARAGVATAALAMIYLLLRRRRSLPRSWPGDREYLCETASRYGPPPPSRGSGGNAGVREPRRPRPSSPGAAAVALPDDA